jgi:hypothetical protein
VFCKCLLITMLPTSACVLPFLSKYPTWCRSTFEPCRHDLTMPSCIHPIRSSKRILSLIAPMIDPLWNLRKSLTLELEKVLFHSEHPLEMLDQEDKVMKRNTSRVMKPNLILQGAMSPKHGREAARDTEKFSSFQLSRYHSFSLVNASFVVSCAAILS